MAEPEIDLRSHSVQTRQTELFCFDGERESGGGGARESQSTDTIFMKQIQVFLVPFLSSPSEHPLLTGFTARNIPARRKPTW